MLTCFCPRNYIKVVCQLLAAAPSVGRCCCDIDNNPLISKYLLTHYCLDMPSNLRPYAFIIDVTCINCFRLACVGRISGSKLCINVFLNVCPHHHLSPGSEHGSHIVCPHVGSWLSAALLYVNINTHILSLSM